LGISSKRIRLLEDAGFSSDSARSREAMLEACSDRLASPQYAWWIPGRIEVLGKHTDYAGGRSLLCATDIGIVCVASPRADSVLDIKDVRSGEEETFDLKADLQTATGDWTNYPRTAARRLWQNFGALRGANVAFTSDLPLAAGMSSSSALIVAFSLVIMRLNDLSQTDTYRENIASHEDLAGYLGTVENGKTFGTLAGDAGVGTFGGSEDHTAILCSSSDQLKQYSFCPIRHEKTVHFPDNHFFVIASSGVVAEKTGAALELYNRASRLAGATASALSKGVGESVDHIAAAVGRRGPETLRGFLRGEEGEFSSEDLLDRFDQFLIESEELIPHATRAMSENNLASFANDVFRSQETGARLLKNQVEQTEWLARRAVELEAMGASAFGAGFGGSVWALVNGDTVSGFVDTWHTDYIARFPEFESACKFIVTRPGPAAFEITG
jgi:galactokinase